MGTSVYIENEVWMDLGLDTEMVSGLVDIAKHIHMSFHIRVVILLLHDPLTALKIAQNVELSKGNMHMKNDDDTIKDIQFLSQC